MKCFKMAGIELRGMAAEGSSGAVLTALTWPGAWPGWKKRAAFRALPGLPVLASGLLALAAYLLHRCRWQSLRCLCLRFEEQGADAPKPDLTWSLHVWWSFFCGANCVPRCPLSGHQNSSLCCPKGRAGSTKAL